MIKDFLFNYSKLIATYPDKIKVESTKIDDNFIEIVIYADKADTGKIIGKAGKTINALKTVILAYKSKDPTSYKINVKSLEE